MPLTFVWVWYPSKPHMGSFRQALDDAKILRVFFLLLGFLNKVSNILIEFTAVTRYLIPLERGTQDAAHEPVYYHTFFE